MADIYLNKAEAAIDYDKIVRSINHRGYCAEAPENTLAAYRLSKAMGFNYVEADISFTKDGVPVLSHDATINRCSNGTGSIAEMTYEQLRTYDFGSWKSADYAGEKMPNFKEFIRLCRSLGLHPYIELKSNGAYTADQICMLVDIVKKYGMEGRVSWISFNIDFLRIVANHDHSARIGYLRVPDTDDKINYLKDIRNLGCEVFSDSSCDEITDDIIARLIKEDIPLEVWTVNDNKKLKDLNPYITGVTTDNLICGKTIYKKYIGNEWEALHIIDSSELQNVSLTASSNNTASASNRISYNQRNLFIKPSTTYKIAYTSLSDSKVGIHTYNENAYSVGMNAESYDNSDKQDSGWQTSGYEWTSPAKINGFSVKGVWLTFNTGSKDEISDIVIYEEKD